MEHSYYKDKLSAYFDSELEVQEMELLRRHLEGCAECRKLLEKLSSLSQKIEELSGLDENEYFGSLATRIVGKIADLDNKVVELPRKEFHRFGFGWKIGALAASFMLIATVTYYQWQDHESILDEIIEQSNKPAQSIRVLGGSEVQSESVLEEVLEEKAATAPLKEIEKDMPAGVGESKAKVISKKVAKGIPDIITKFETSSQSIVKPAPVLKQEQVKEDESREDIAEKIVADFQMINLPVTRLAAQTEREEVIVESVQYWRTKRDSLLIVEDEVYQAVSGRKLKSVALSDSDKSGYNSKDSALAFIWYKIGLLTSDSAEKKEAIEFLETHSKRSKADSALIREYLEKLKD
ncbi:MAG: zf-HC2 domain-containing protein [candidate division Zixibacteria bacterium]|nr:zf-HC2 domain-containing protein [candidate division Zixibacteria bacterium]